MPGPAAVWRWRSTETPRGPDYEARTATSSVGSANPPWTSKGAIISASVACTAACSSAVNCSTVALTGPARPDWVSQ